MHDKSIAALLCGVSLTALGTLAAQTASAQDAGPVVELGSIVVTGENLDRSLAGTASSVEVMTEEELDETVEADSVAEVARDVPNVTYAAPGGQGGAPTIRGQSGEGPNSGANAFFGGTVPRVSTSVDGHYLSYNELIYGKTALWDVESVEVFRGPQTVAQGANSIAGAIVTRTKDPTFTREGVAQLLYGSRDKTRASLAVSGPLGKDVAARLSLDWLTRENFIDYTDPDFAETEQDYRSFTGRAKLLYAPEAMPGLEAKLTYEHVEAERPTWEAATGDYDDLESVATSNPSWAVTSDTAIADLSYDFGGAELSNQLVYSDSFVERTTEPASGGSAEIDSQVWSNETRLTFGDETATLHGVVGLFASHTVSDEHLSLRGDTDYDDDKTSLGLFAEANWRFAESWTLTGGLRYQRDRVERDGTSTLSPAPLDYDETFEAVLPKLALAYEVRPGTTLGASVGKGYNPGGVTLNLGTGDYVEFDEETVWTYELFARTSLLDDRLMLTGNLFYSDYSDAQRYVVTNDPSDLGYAITVNAEKAKSYGLELGADYAVTDSLSISGGLGLLETEIEKIDSAIADYEGNEFARAPSYTLRLGADWDITDAWTLSGQVRRTDGYHSDDENASETEVDAYTVADARVSYSPRENMEIFGYVNNIFDDRSETYLRLSRSVGGYEASVVEPREIGIGAKIKF